MLGQVPRQQPRADVVVVADLVADDHLDLPALVELLGALGLRAAGRERKHERDAAAAERTHSIARSPALFRRALLHQRGGGLVVALLARQQRA